MTWVWIAGIGGIVGLDATSFPQAMISRPLVAAALAGVALGRPVEGVAIGVILELFALVILPIGAARYPEAGTASVAASGAYAMTAGGEVAPDLLLLAIIFGLAWEHLAGASVRLLRQWNEWIVADAPRRGVVSAARLERLHLAAMAIDLARGGVVSVVGAALGAWLLRGVHPLWAMPGGVVLGVLAVSGAAMLGAALPLFGGWQARRIAFVLGILCGSLLLLTW
jgi:PTS system mannose-specific IIC component